MHIESAVVRERILARLRRIEGQARGVQTMIDEHRDCREVVQQLAAIRSAVNQAALEVIRTYASQCLTDPGQALSEEEVLDYVLNAVAKWS